VLELRAANRTRPIIRLPELQADPSDALYVKGAAGSFFVLDGITVTGNGMEIAGPAEPSLEITDAPLCVTIDHSILGAIQVEREQVKNDPLRLRIADSIVDAIGYERVALGATGKLCADVRLTVCRSTILGRIEAHIIDLAENSILMGHVLACRRQLGCVRFCYVAPGSRTPRRYECQPDLVEQAVGDLYAKGDFDALTRDELVRAERLRVEPEFDSVRYGTPTYGRLAAACAVEITAGADDQSEMGVFHDLYAPQRVANLRQRLDEYTPAGMDAGIIFAS
jgi:hypothetical protein